MGVEAAVTEDCITDAKVGMRNDLDELTPCEASHHYCNAEEDTVSGVPLQRFATVLSTVPRSWVPPGSQPGKESQQLQKSHDREPRSGDAGRHIRSWRPSLRLDGQ